MAFGEGEGGGGGRNNYLVGVAIMVLVLAAIFTIGPIIMAQMFQATTGNASNGISDTNPWNATNSSNGIQSGVTMWNQTTIFEGLAVLVMLAVIILKLIGSI
jgi:hypothetical protein